MFNFPKFILEKNDIKICTFKSLQLHLIFVIVIIYQEDPLSKIKKVDCSLLPPTLKTLEMKVLRTQYVTCMWTHAGTPCPTEGISPLDYGWSIDNTVLQPVWFEGRAMPEHIFSTNSETDEEKQTSEEDNNSSDDEPWSEDSDSDDDHDED